MHRLEINVGNAYYELFFESPTAFPMGSWRLYGPCPRVHKMPPEINYCTKGFAPDLKAATDLASKWIREKHAEPKRD